ncbi:position-specific antigen beta subunit myospheroid isoform X1 [Rhodnius prolixus]|uniref:position-specific antigen beta subunit myospheroid isoform X1 n=1 Tax=Rhodnius prolixus TaxID=13249 RepID=UPI003D18C585
MLLIKWLVVISCWFLGVWCQQAEKLTQDPCVLKQTCHECIQTPTCAWCAQPNFKEDQKRCFQPNAEAIIQCASEFVYNPDNEYTIRESKKLTKISQSISQSEYSQSSYSSHSSSSSSSSSSSHNQADIVQIAPQVVNLKLRINEPYRIAVDYSQAQSYPVDLYYLMDLSKSMEDDKHKLSALGNILSDSMKNITSNFRLGFGSFVDKVVMPYVSVVPKKLIHPCDSCVAPYGFRNHMPLSSDTDEFSGEVEQAAVSGNLDAPEGGFDAIMQAVVCWNQIGWRDKARKLLVFSTDAGFHYAGDGKLGGIVKPNDGKCHLDNSGHYTHSTIQDYPSVSQINLKVKENSINVIFAVTSEQIGVYDRLRAHIQGSSAGVLSNDSSNVVELVKAQYNKITSEVEMKDTASSAVKITYYSNCLNPNDPVKKTTKCEGLKVDSEVRFQAEIEVKACPPNKKDWKQTFKIYPVGLNESLTVHLEMECDCPCENKGNKGYIEEAKECSSFGTYKCGICECDDTHFGRTCECDAQNTRQDESGASCRPDNTTLIECSGRGSCVCGQCQCDPRPNPLEVISGAYCECDNFSCDRVDGVLCSGPDHGVCVCGHCDCLEGWSGEDCSCSTSEELCRPPGGGEICSGHGVCHCGKCICNNEESDTQTGRYSGKYCDKCPTCPGRCQELKECVQCQVHKTGPLTEEECATNCTFVPEVVKTIEVDESKDENLCSYIDEEDCHFVYVYSYDEKGKIVVRAKKERQCPPEVFILAIVLGVIGAIVLIGLAILLLWKLLTTIHDRREFAKFEKDTMLAKWDTVENPIYKQATSTFKNPTYAGK